MLFAIATQTLQDCAIKILALTVRLWSKTGRLEAFNIEKLAQLSDKVGYKILTSIGEQ